MAASAPTLLSTTSRLRVSSAAAFRAAALSVDGTRPLTANHVGDADLSAQLDVQGFSHKANRSFAAFHAQSPAKPAVLSECCSCTADDNQRLGSRALPPLPDPAMQPCGPSYV